MEKVALDTDVLVDFLRGKGRAVKLLAKLMSKGASLATTVINAFELYWGAYKFGGAKRLVAVDKLLNRLTILNITTRESKTAGEEIAYLESIGLPIDIRDLLIGVIARENGYSILTGNVEHFNRIRQLNVN